MTIAQLHETPTWLNVVILGASWLASFLQPLALLVTITWGALQIYGWIVNKGWRKK